MIDVQAVGGVTEWMKVASMAEAFNLSVVSHLFEEFSAQFFAAVANSTLTQHAPWWRGDVRTARLPAGRQCLYIVWRCGVHFR